MDTYEKKYNEAMLRADEAVQKGCLDKDMFDIIFPPEISEDERIRKELIEFIKWSVDRHFMREDFHQAKRPSEWIAYLEKQKELFESGRGLYYYDGEKTTYCGYPATEENPYDFVMSQQEEQKPAEWSEEDEDKVAQYLHDRDGGMLWSKATEITRDILDMIRPSWKPSEEQIQALEYVVSSIPPNYLKEQEYIMTLIGQVIQQLKKLWYGSNQRL